jgi:hypothetical protein
MKPDRVPYAERDRQINEFCSCHHVWSEGENGTRIRHERLWRDPACKLHGNTVQPEPY